MTHLARLHWPDVDPRALLAVPVGSTEQHGPHLPLDTDTVIAMRLCELLASRRPDVVIAPAVPYGSSGEHHAFPGTLSIGRSALTAVLIEIVRSSAFTRCVFVNAHGGNQTPVAHAHETLTGDGHDVMSWAPRIEGGDAHAGRSETSMLLALDPQYVRGNRTAAGNLAPLRELMPALAAGHLRDIAPTGVLGDPSVSTAEEGREIWSMLESELAAAVELRWPR